MTEVTKLVIGIFMTRMSKDAIHDQSVYSKNFMQFDDYNYQMMNKQLFK